MKQMGYSRRDFVKQSTLAAIAITPAANALSKFTNTKNLQWFIDCGFRLTNHRTLLNLEFYFINVKYKDGCITKKLKFFYGQEESYMIVRLPQQHIAEQSYDVTYTTAGCVFDDTKAPKKDWTAITRISGYSYLVFKIQFPPDKNKRKIELTEENLLNWNNQALFKLVVRQNLNESLFEIITNNSKENEYPFNYLKNGTNYEFNYDKYPKAYGDPITTIEAPWRLILSPKLPDQDRFRWKWEFSKNPKTEKILNDAELWFASLSIEEIPEYKIQLQLKKQFQEKSKENNSQLKTEIEQIINKIELMILGSPDKLNRNKDDDNSYLKTVDNIFKKYYLKSDNTIKPISHLDYLKLSESDKNNYTLTERILPENDNRWDLVELYIKYKLVARTEKLTFSPLGFSAYIEFKNEKFEETSAENVLNKVLLLEWKHLISLGRDEEVEIVKLIIDKEVSHKYLHIQSCKRRTKRGLSYLDYREYIMPLTLLVNFEEHINERVSGETISKFKSPFKSFEITEVKPKRICPLASMDAAFIKNVTYKVNGKGDDMLSRIYYPQTFNPETKNAEYLTFEYEAIDWQEKSIKFKKKIQAIELSINDAIVNGKIAINDIDNFFDSQNIKTQDLKVDVQKKYEDLSNAITDKINTTTADIKDKWKKLETDFNFYRKTILEIGAAKLNEGFNSSIIELHKNTKIVKSTINEIVVEFENLKTYYFKTSQTTEAEIEQYIKEFEDKSATLKSKIEAKITDTDFQLFLISKLSEINSTVNNVKNAYAGIGKSFIELKNYFDIDSKIKDDILKINSQWQKLKDSEREYINQINLYQNEIIYSVKDLTRQAEDKYKETISNLKTDFVLFKGQLKENIENKTIDFFNQYASIPQLQKAQVYINSLSKIVNEEIPVEIKYANDYINSQIDLTKLEIEKNASKVFAEITEGSREYLKGKIRNVAADMGGYINPELPVEFLTYLKDPKKILETIPDVSQEYNDLIFLSQQAKDAWNTSKSINPKQYFQDLKAKILGSIDLTDIIKTDFELPRLANNGDNITYTFITDKITSTIELGPITFYNRNKKAQLEVFLQKSIKEPQKYRSYTKLSSFSIGINQPFPQLFTILFDYFQVESSSESSKKTQVKILDVSFGGPLNFLGKLAEAIKIPGTGLRVVPSLRKIEIGYTFSMPGIETPTFNFTNLKFDIGLKIPLPTGMHPEPLTTTFSINKPDDKFLITVGIFGGRGHFVIEAEPTKIQSVDAAIEFGGYLGINLGIAAGYVYLFAGIRYIYTHGQSFSLTAYIICGGGVTVFGFISVTVTFFLGLQYEGATNSLYGTASVSYCIKIAFFKKSFTLSYSKRIAGAERQTPANPENSQAYIYNPVDDEILYAYAGDELLLAEPKKKMLEQSVGNEIQTDLKSFKNIYSKSVWEEYCNSFNF